MLPVPVNLSMFFLLINVHILRYFHKFEQFLVAPSNVRGGSISFSGCIQLLGFCTFEACVGIFWPSIMKMRSQYIPEEARSTIMNFFRIPLNIFVCVVLYNVSSALEPFSFINSRDNSLVLGELDALRSYPLPVLITI